MVIYGTPVAPPGQGIVSRFPKSWLTSVTVVRSGGRDAKGNPLPTSEIPVADCIVAPRATSDPVDRSDVVDGKSVLYRDPGFRFYSTDLIRVPDGSFMAGDWAVDGRPGEWPFGVEVGLVRA